MLIMRVRWPCLILLLLSPLPLLAQGSEALRGAWITDMNGARHVLYIVLRDGQVSGFHCFDCSNPDNLSFIDDGSLDSTGLHFSLYRYPGMAAAAVDKVDARLDAGILHLDLHPQASAAVTMELHRAPPRQDPPPIADFRPNQPGPGRARTLPGAAEQLTPAKVLGLWLWGTGPTKQYFVFKRHKDGMRGMVCGPCDSARDFAPLEKISMNDTGLHFEIVHEDNGGGFAEHGPFSNVTDAEISLNEMLLTTRPSFDPQGSAIEMTLLGPVHYMPPAAAGL